MQEYPSVGEELDHIAVRFTWRGQEYEAKFDDFDGNSEPIPELSVKSAVQTR